MRIQIGISHGQAVHLKFDVCQVEIFNTVDEIFTLEYQEIDFQTTPIMETVNFGDEFEILVTDSLTL